MNNIHKTALDVFGLNGRLQKLRRELVEAANAVDRYDENKGTVDAVLSEMRDVLYVWESILMSAEFVDAIKRCSWHEHERVSESKLKLAITDKLNT